MEYFRGDTFLKNIKAQNYTFQEGDKIHIAILKNAYSKEYLYEEVIEVDGATDTISLEISAEEMAKLPVDKLLLEIEMTTSDIVKTHQYDLVIKADGIYERN